MGAFHQLNFLLIAFFFFDILVPANFSQRNLQSNSTSSHCALFPDKELPDTGAPVVTNPHGSTHLVPQPAGGKGEAHGDLINCFTCPLILKFCCGIFCCSEAQYNEYVKLQGLPRN